MSQRMFAADNIRASEPVTSLTRHGNDRNRRNLAVHQSVDLDELA